MAKPQLHIALGSAVLTALTLDVSAVAQTAVQFSDITAQCGINFTHTDRLDTMAGGLCFLDYDNDGDQDLFVTSRGTAINRLYENQGSGTFVDVTLAAGVGDQLETLGAYAADLDNDGLQDLLVLARYNVRIYQNNGNGTFTNVAARSRTINCPWPSSATFGDYDHDGDLDIYIGNYIGEGFFPYFDGNPNQLLRNDGNLTFVDVARQAGCDGQETFMDPRGFVRTTWSCTLSVLFYDYDFDGWQDIFVGNDFGPFIIPNQLFRNLGNGHFQEVAASAGFRIAEFNMGLATADVNGDGYPDLYTSNFGNNHLLLNDGRGRFQDVATQRNALEGTSAGVFLVSWAAMFLDADLDALIDLYVSNGYIQAAPAMPADPLSPSRLLQNLGQTFAAVPSAQFPWDTGIGRGAACADIDGDGDEDIVQLNNRQALKIFRNDTQSSHHAAMLDLVGTLSNRDAVGTRLTIHSRQFSTSLEHQRGGSYGSDNGTTIIRGLGDDAQVDELSLIWPSGIESRRFGLAGDVRHRIVEPRVTVARIGRPTPVGPDFVEVLVDVENHASSAEPVTFTAKLELHGTRYDLPAYHFPATIGGGGTATVPVYLPIPGAALPVGRQLGVWMNIGTHDHSQGTDELEVPIR